MCAVLAPFQVSFHPPTWSRSIKVPKSFLQTTYIYIKPEKVPGLRTWNGISIVRSINRENFSEVAHIHLINTHFKTVSYFLSKPTNHLVK